MKLKFFLLFAAGIFLLPSAFGYSLEGQSWTRDRSVVMQLSLGGPQALSDGFTSFNQSAQDALDLWSQHLTHLRFKSVLNSPVPPDASDYEMSVLFSNTVFGDSFGSDVLAITLLNYRGADLSETDTLFNTAYSWDSYRGAIHAMMMDFHRVAIHEFGHTLGLDHPDDAGQHVAAIMNSRISSIDHIEPDDITGLQSIYSTGPAYRSSVNAPVLLNISTRGLIGTGENVLIGGFIIQGTQPATLILRAIGYSLRAVGISAPIRDPVITVYDGNQQIVATNDDWIASPDAETIASFQLDPPSSIESALFLTLPPGSYTAVVKGFSDADTPPATGIGLVEIYDLATTGSRAGNISTRGQVKTGDNVMVAGFIIGGMQSKKLVLRAIGPSLSRAGVAAPLADPTLELHNANGALLQSNDNWSQSPNARAISNSGLAPTNPRESAIYATLNPGSYTAIVRGVNNGTGTAVVEVYDLSPSP